MNATWLFLTSLLSLIGMAVAAYGWRQRLMAPTLVGLACMVYPYFISGTAALIGIGVVLLGALIIGTRLEGSL